MRSILITAALLSLSACLPAGSGGGGPLPLDGGPSLDGALAPDRDAGDAAPAEDARPGPDRGLDALDRGPATDAGPTDAGPPQDGQPTDGQPADARPQDARPPGPTCADLPDLCPGPTQRCADDPAGPRCVCDFAAPRAALLADVPALDFTDALPSALTVHGPAAFPLIVDAAGRPVAAAAYHGAGRVFVAAHEGVLSRDPADNTGFGTLTDNALEWLGGRRPTVLVDPGYDGLARALTARGYRVRRGGPADLAPTDIYATTAYPEHPAADRAALAAHVEAGGGLFLGGHAWWWAQGGGDAPRDFPGNHTLRPFGITVLAETADGGRYPLPARAADPLHQARCGLEALTAEAEGRAALSPADRARAATAAGGAVAALPLDAPLFEAAAALAEATGPVIPTAADPVRPAREPLRALAARIQVRLALDAPPEQITAHPAADDFPGPVPADAPRIGLAISYDLRYPGYPEAYAFSGASAPIWLPTFLYAPPGAPITVRTPPAAVGQGLTVQIGAHSDTLWHRDTWERMPALIRRAPLDAPRITTASGFGGPLYLTVPPGTRLGQITLEIEGGVRMPVLYAGGDAAEFSALAAAGDAPWAELISGKLGMLLPTERAAEIRDPLALIAFWDTALDLAADLAGFPRERARAERFVFDRQISAGWMHSGYPIMGHLPTVDEVSDLAALRRDGAWGPFHELGHNHQWIDWVLPGTIETSCNLWSIYLSEALTDRDRATAHPELSPAARARRLTAWRARPNPQTWEIWTALETYLQLQEAFGWDWLPPLFAEYAALPDAQRPRDDAARIQQWIRRSSRAIGRDLTAFYAAWAFPIDPATAAAVADLPPWHDHPMR